MRDLLSLLLHLLTTLAILLGRGGTRAVIAETLLVKHQLVVLNRSRRRAPNLTALDRAGMGLSTLFINPSRMHKLAIVLKPATLLGFHQALKTRRFRRLFSSQKKGKPGPRGPSQELIEALVEMKRRNPRYGNWCSFAETVQYRGWQNGYVERVIGSIRHDLLDYGIVLSEAHLRKLLRRYADYYNGYRTHLGLEKDAPNRRPVLPFGRISALPQLGGLHHAYVRM